MKADKYGTLAEQRRETAGWRPAAQLRGDQSVVDKRCADCARHRDGYCKVLACATTAHANCIHFVQKQTAEV